MNDDDNNAKQAYSGGSPTPPAKPTVWPMVGVIWAVAAFVAGTLFSFGIGYGRGNTSLDNLVLSVNRLEGAVQSLNERFGANDKAVTQELQKIEDHLTYDDQRISRFEDQRPHFDENGRQQQR